MAPTRKAVALLVAVATTIATFTALPALAAPKKVPPSKQTPTEPATQPTTDGTTPKLILTGMVPTAAWLQRQLSRKQDLPFDGFVFKFTKDVNHMLGDTLWTEADVALSRLPKIPWGRYERFVVLHAAGPYTFDWFDQAAWDRTLSNMRLTSKAVTAAGASGIFFEPYFKYYANGFQGPWDYSAARMQGKTLDQMKAIVRARGAEVMEALQSSAPDIRILARFLNSLSAESAGGAPTTAGSFSPLLPSFVEGMLEAAGPGVKLIDAVDKQMVDDTRRFAYNHELVDVVGRSVVDPALRDKYTAQVEAGAGVYFDVLMGIDTRWGYDFPLEYRRQWLQHSIYQATLSSHEYVWVLSKFANFWTDRNVPADATELIRTPHAAALAGQPLGYDLVKEWGSDKFVAGRFVSAPPVQLVDDGQALRAEVTAGVTAVQFIVDGMVHSTVSAAPFTLALSDLAPGTHLVVARALHADAAHTSSNVVTVQV